MTEQTEEKPNIDVKLNLRVRSQDGQQVTFQAKPTTKLSKLMKAYCDRQVVDIRSVVFSYDGQRLREDQTPGELEMEDNDFIDVLQHQVKQVTQSFLYSKSRLEDKIAELLCG